MLFLLVIDPEIVISFSFPFLLTFRMIDAKGKPGGGHNPIKLS